MTNQKVGRITEQHPSQTAEGNRANAPTKKGKDRQGTGPVARSSERTQKNHEEKPTN